jgi:hypothetical protein
MNYQHAFLPFTFTRYDAGDEAGYIQHYQATFWKDFGPYRSGETVDCLVVSCLLGTIYELDDNGESLRITRFYGVVNDEVN